MLASAQRCRWPPKESESSLPCRNRSPHSKDPQQLPRPSRSTTRRAITRDSTDFTGRESQDGTRPSRTQSYAACRGARHQRLRSDRRLWHSSRAANCAAPWGFLPIPAKTIIPARSRIGGCKPKPPKFPPTANFPVFDAWRRPLGW
jgi:hypothetical protein